MNGILIIDKPVGLTSHDIVARLRRILRTKKIGHTGTLDPFATGVLVMLVGKATKLAKFLDKDEKTYKAIVRFGFETNTGDRTGEPRENISNGQIPTFAEINNVLQDFIGEIDQIPPMYSAKKVKGKKLYELARKGIEIERSAVQINVTKLTLTECKTGKTKDETIDCFELEVASSAGTYIRTLAEDIGRKAGFPCHLAELRRTKAGAFEIDQSVTLEELERIVEDENLAEILVTMNKAVSHLPECKLDENGVQRISNGMRVDASFDDESVQEVRLTNTNEDLVAIGIYDNRKQQIQPRNVFIN